MNKRILIFASGRGSNAEALHEAAVDGTIKGRIVGVICDHHDAPVLQRAERWKVPAEDLGSGEIVRTRSDLSGRIYAYLWRKFDKGF